MRIEGRNPVLEALRAGALVRGVKLSSAVDERKGRIATIAALARERGIPVETVAADVLDAAAETRAHQGVVADADFEYRSWRDAVDEARSRGAAPFLLALDGITDPQNTGSLIRSAHVLGAHAVLLPGRRAAQVTPVVAKASAGAVWHIPIEVVGNLERALAACREAGIWVVALDADGEAEVSNCPLLSEPLALVVGSEGEGVSSLIRKRADARVRIAQFGRIDSLGAAAAGAIALHEAAQARKISEGGTQLSGSVPERIERSSK